jgi:hypothetical protein
MKLVSKLKYAGPAVLLLLFAAPAFAQFEVSPDHVDDQQTTKNKKPAPKAKAQHAQPNAARQSANGTSSANTGTTVNSASNQASQHPGPKNTSSAAAKRSSTPATKLQSQSKKPNSPTAHHLSASANTVPRE